MYPCSSTCITVMGGYTIALLFPQWGPNGPWYIATLYGIVLGAWMYRRFARGKWRSIHLEDDDATRRAFEVIPITSPDASNRDATSAKLPHVQLTAEQ